MAVTEANSKKVFFSGILLLSISTVLVKIIGLIYKIPMLSYLGSEGMGYFNSAYEIYALFCIIATAGLPVALSVLISGAIAKGENDSVDLIYHSTLKIFLLLGFLGSVVMWVGAKGFCLWIHSDGAFYAIRSISPTVFLICLSSAVRGYFQGFQRMLPTALSQLLESMGKLVFGLLFASLALEKGYSTEEVAAAAGWGLTFGTALSTVYLLIEKRRASKKHVALCARTTRRYQGDGKGIWLSLAKLAVPMTLGASLISVTKLIDMTMILRRLQSIGYTESTANEAYGSYTTLALSIFAVLPTLLNSVSLPLVPILSSSIASGNLERQKQMIETSYRLTAFFAIPGAIGVTAFSFPILNLIFSHEPNAVATAAPLLSLLGISIFLSAMITATNSVLHAYRRANLPIFSMLVGTAVKTAVAYFLIGNPRFGLMGAPISSFFCNVTIVILNFIFASKLCNEGFSVKKIFLKPFGASVISVGLALLTYRYFSIHHGEGSLLTVSVLLFCIIVYFSVSVLFGSITAEDIRVLPMGERCYLVFQRLKSLFFKENRQKTDV